MKKPRIWRLTALQAIVTGLFALGSLVLDGSTAAISATIGGLLSLLPGLYFAMAVFRHQGARSAQIILQTTYRAEFVKIALTATGFTAAFILVKPLSAGYLFTAFIAVQACHWTAPWLLRSSTGTHKRPD